MVSAWVAGGAAILRLCLAAKAFDVQAVQAMALMASAMMIFLVI
jgi:hypothetical protein